MKYIYSFILILLPCLIFAQVDLPDYSKLKSVVIPPPGYQYSPDGITSTPKIINGFDNLFLGIDYGEPYIVTNPNDPLNAVCAFNINNLYYTIDGFNWIKNTPSFPGYGVLGDPVLAFDSLGNVYYTTLYQNGSVYGLAIVKSTNKGLNWSSPISMFSTTVGLADKEWITADQTAGPYSNYLYAGWRQFGTSGMRFIRSSNGGNTWSSPITLAGDQGAYIAVGPNGSIPGGSVYFACAMGGYIAVYRSTNGGQTFGAYVLATPYFIGPGTICYGRYTVKNCIRTDNFPRMAVDNSYTSTRGNVYVVYAANPNIGADKANIYLVRSTDYGVTWAAPVKVNDDNTTTDQWMPAISVDKSGRVFVSWYDSRIDTASNIMTMLYGAVSTNGGVSFAPNQPISNAPFNPNNMAVGGSGDAKYIGDYIGNNPTGNSCWHVWMDGRDNNLGSYVGYYPDFGLITNPNTISLNNNDSAIILIKVPGIKGPFNDRVKFTATLDSLPLTGSISLTFLNGKDSITNFPDSTYLKVKANGVITTRLYKLTISGAGKNGTPVHKREIEIYANLSVLSVGTNREPVVDFKVNGVQYNTRQQFIVPNNTVMNVEAISPKIAGGSKFVFQYWSDFGDTAHNVTVNGNIFLTAYYKIQYKIVVVSSIGNAFGNNTFIDSAQNGTFGVYSRFYMYNNVLYQFRGWTGAGNNSYTSPDSTGIDTVVTIPIYNPIVQTARWTPAVGITQIGNEIPDKYELYQNYPNPFNPSTVINYDLKENSSVKLILYDLVGREVSILLNEYQSAGRYKYVLDMKNLNLSSGIYFYRIQANEFTDIKKLIFLK